MHAAGSVHLSVHLTSGSRAVEYSVDAAPDSGRQEVSVNNGAQATIIQVGDLVYVRGNETALTSFFGLTTTLSGQLSDRWFSLTSSDAGYAQVTEDVALPSVAGEMKLAGPLTLTGRTTVDGQAVEGVHGTVPAGLGAPTGSTATIYITITGRHLPVEYTGGGSTAQTVATYSEWGEQVHLTPPSGATSLTSTSS
jgi:hypothetical protein